MSSNVKSNAYNYPRMGFWTGFTAPVSGLKLALKSPKICSLVLIPFAINLALYFLFFYYGSHYFSDFFHIKNHHLFFRVLLWLFLALLAALSFTVVSAILCVPFNDPLCKEALRYLAKTEGIEIELRHSSLFETLKLEISRLIVLILGSIFVLILSFIPLLQIPGLILGCFLVSFEYFGFPISFQSKKLSTVFFYVLKNPMVSIGFGAFLLLMMTLPFTIIFYIPMAVLGGAKIYFKTLVFNDSLAKQDKHKRT